MVSFDDLIPQSNTKKQPKNSMVDSLVAGAGQTYSLGFGDEAIAGLTAPVVYGASKLMNTAYSDKGLADTYKTLRDQNRTQIKEAESDNPKSYYTGVVAGAVANPAKFTGNIVKQGVKSGLAFGLGDSESESLGGMAADALKGGAAGLVTGKVLQGAGKLANAAVKGTQNVVKGFNARGVDALESTANQIDDVASTAFKSMRQSGAVFNKPRIINITNKVEGALTQDTKLNARLHGDTMGILDDFKKDARAGDFDFESLHQYRRLFNGVVKKNLMNNPDDARLAKMAIGKIDDEISNLKPIDVRGGNIQAVNDLQTGLKEWSKLRKFETISDIVEKSQGDVNYLKRELTKLANNPRKYGFSGDELKALKDASKLTNGEAALKVLGKAGFDPSRLGSGVGAFFGSTAGGVLGGTTGAAIVPIVGTTAKYGQKLVGRGKTERLLNAIETGSYNAPVGVSIPQSVQGAVGRTSGAIGVNAINENPSEIMPDQAPQLALDFNDLIPNASPQSSNRNYLEGIKQAESGGNPNAKNPNSSASGLYQFTDDTWRNSVAKWGKQYGIGFEDKNNPQAQELMARELAQDNANILTAKLDRQPNIEDIYMAHVFGANQAVKLLSQLGSNRPAIDMVPPKVVGANMSIFFNGSRPRTVEQVYALLGNKIAS